MGKKVCSKHLCLNLSDRLRLSLLDPSDLVTLESFGKTRRLYVQDSVVSRNGTWDKP